jgi:hypothetical protein
MIHMKYFEGFGGDYYEEIDVDDYYDNLDRRIKIHVVPRSSIKKISGLFSWGVDVDDNNDIISVICPPTMARRGCEYGIFLYEVDDEYFYVCVTKYFDGESFTYYYRCDQFDGLKKLLKDKGII